MTRVFWTVHGLLGLAVLLTAAFYAWCRSGILEGAQMSAATGSSLFAIAGAALVRGSRIAVRSQEAWPPNMHPGVAYGGGLALILIAVLILLASFLAI